MKLTGTLVGEPLADAVQKDNEALKGRVMAAMRRATDGLQTRLRAETRTVLGNRVAAAWRKNVYPQNALSAEPAGRVHTRAPAIVAAFDAGLTIVPRKGRYLAIPTAAAGRDGNRRMTPARFETRTGRKLQFVPRPRGGGWLIVQGADFDSRGALRSLRRGSVRGRVRTQSARGRAVTAIVFILVRQARLPKRLDLARQADAALADFAGRLATALQG